MGLGEFLASESLLNEAIEYRMSLYASCIRQPNLAVVAQPVGFRDVIEGYHVIDAREPCPCCDKPNVEVPIVAVVERGIKAENGYGG